ncbi:hydrocephalus-inducing protein homolog isoform X2 [Argopecten irradians]|uniref:hydrocephalus-inducing protein homolog isoform X2 n=1 Tax=Argopecten irradians TaxID=31199 RepID=UPI00371FD74D
MPLGPFGEVVGTTGTLEALGPEAANYKSKVIAPRNPKLLKPGDVEGHKMTPSKFLFDMQMDTEQKLANTHYMKVPRKIELLDMADTSLQKFSQVNIDEPMFQPYPSEIYFQNFKPFEVYEVPLILRNNDKVPRLVKVTQADSPYFKVISPHDVGHKVGPGLPTTFKIEFTPDEKKDYNHELVCITEREKFIVPVKAIGSRAILDFPDNIVFPVGPVKNTMSRTLLIRNIGNKEAKFTLSVDKPFSVSPEIGTLPVQDSMQVTVEFNPKKTGDHTKDLNLHYHTGEDVLIALHGQAQDGNVRLDKNSLRIENTFISMANERTVTIHNRSDVIAHFRWTQFATQEEEDQQKHRMTSTLTQEEQSDTEKFLQECVQDPTLRDKLSILGRTFQNRRMLVENDSMLFNDDVVKVEPVEGDIWPNSSFEVNVIFKPREAQSYTRTAFCDITGRESRLPLRIRGDGIGPSVQFSFESLDMGNIFIGSKHTYEVVLANKGDIDAIYSVMPNSSIFGPCFSFNPSEGIVMPGGHQAIHISFSSPYLGDFLETFKFQIDGQPDILEVQFSGSVIGPTFQFNVPKLKFGVVSYGFLNTQTCMLQNTSLVPMTFHLRVPGDGNTDSICCTSDLESESSPPLPKPGSGLPREFEIIPASGTLQPQSETKITVKFISNTIKKYEMVMVVDVDNVGEEILSLPIHAKCIVPNVTVLSPMLDYGRCFLRHSYEHSVKLHNDTDLPAKYELIQQYVDQDTPITYNSPKPKGIVEPHSLCEVPMIIQAEMLEEQQVISYFSIFGSPDPPLSVQMSCTGEGPVVHISPMDLDWNVIPVLTDTPMKVTLSNESLIPAKFTAHMVRNKSVFHVEPSEGEIPAEKTLELTVTANLNDCVRFQDKLQVNFFESQVRHIPLTAYGQGTTIVSDPPLTPHLNLGPNFSNRPLQKTFTLTNKSRRHQQLVWSMDGFGPIAKAKKEMASYNALDMKFKNTPPPPEPRRPIFRLNPNRFDLPPGASMDMHIEGMVDSPQSVKERLLCHAIIGRQGGKELIMRVDVSADFISPLLEFSTKAVYFRVDKKPDEELSLQVRELKMTNVSTLPLSTGLKLQHPFQIILDDGSATSEMEVRLDVNEDYTLTIQFDPAYKDDLHIRTIDEILHVTYREHPHIDYIALRGEVYFPNIDFEKTVVDFGCILNDTEVTRYVNITNNSPMEVKYRWSFLVGKEPNVVIRHPPKPVVTLPQIEEAAEEATEVQPEIAVLIQEPSQTQLDEKEEVKEEEEKADFEPTKESEVLLGSSIHGEADESHKEQESDRSFDNKATEEHQSSFHTQDEESLKAVDSDDERPEKGQLEQEAAPEGGVDKNQMEGLRLSLTSLRDITVDEDPLQTNRALSALLENDREETPVGVEEVFDILPLYGILQPGDTEQVTMTFYGHADIWGETKAICEVEGGPTYELLLKGEASLVDYKIDCKEIDYGKQMYDQVASSEITLCNTGKVGFEFCAMGMDPSLTKKPAPGVPIMVPHAGFVEPLSEQKLVIKYLPGVPEVFSKTFQIQVAHFEPDKICIHGEGVFPRISLDLPRTSDPEGHYQETVRQAKENLYSSRTLNKPLTERPQSCLPSSQRVPGDPLLTQDIPSQPPELEVQMELERMTVKEFAWDMQQSQTARLNAGLDTTPPDSNETRESTDTEGRPKRKKVKPKLPEYLLDFGYVVLGTVRTHIVRATNTGWFPTSFQVEREDIHHFGFHVELDRVRNLPGSPDHETVDFVVSFDPRGANLSEGAVETVVPINIINGPVIQIRLRAKVTMPDMEISDDTLDFTETKCGECKVITVQLHNHQQVKCEWNSLPADKDSKKIDKHVPMHLRRKMKQEKQKPRHFEIMPATGTLVPGQRQNVQVKFMPTEEKYYEQRILIRIAQSSQRILLLCRGQGREPHLDFDRNMVEFGPILPHSTGDEQDIIIRNPCSFPIEFYNLEFDSTYLEEEKILRLMKGYDEMNTILLPPRGPSEKLPPELTEYYDEQMKKLEEMERVRREAEEAAAEAARLEEDKDGESGDGDGRGEESEVKTDGALGTAAGSHPPSVIEALDIEDRLRKEEESEARSTSALGVGELEITPVSAAIARHLGIDLTPEGTAARNRRGIAVIVHGAPMSGKTVTAVALARMYEAAILTIDQVVLDAISTGTKSGMRAREMCQEAARKRAEELKLLEGEEMEKKAGGGLSVEAVTAHTQGTTSTAAVSQAHSVVSNRKTSTVSDVKGKDKHHGGSVAGAKTGINTSSIDGATGSQVPSSPPPLAAPIARRLSVSASVAGEEGLMSCVLPEDLLVDIISERLQLNDCHRGVVLDGLETLFAQNLQTAANVILKALNNRRFIYFISLKLDYNVLKEQERKAQEESERLAKEEEEKDRMRLEEMSEDEYDALPEKDKAAVDLKRLEIKKERIRKENEERMERDRLEREAAEAEARRLEEEKPKKKGKKGPEKPKEEPAKDGKKSVAATGKTASTERVQKSQGGPKPHDSDHPVSKAGSSITDRPESHQTEKSDTVLDDGKKGKKGKDGKKPGDGKEKSDKEKGESEAEVCHDPLKESEILLMQRFRTIEHSSKEIADLIEFWDRTTLGIKRPPTPSEKSEEDGQHHPPSGKKAKGKDKHDKQEKEKEKERQKQIEKENAEKAAREAAAAAQGDGVDGEGGEEAPKEEESSGIPHLQIDCSDKSVTPFDKLMGLQKLPSMNEVLDGIGLGPRGPPIPPSATFAVVPYPVKRRAPPVSEFGGRYIFVASSPDDPNIGLLDSKDPEPEEEKSVTPDKGNDLTTPTKGKSGKTDKSAGKEDKKGERKKSAERKQTSKTTSRRNSMQVPSPPPGAATPVSDLDSTTGEGFGVADSKTPKLSIFRWIVPANGEVTLRLRFQSEELGQFDQTLNFEIVGTRRRYQLYCRGICAFPSISREPRIVFPSRKKNKKSDEIVHKKYVLSSETFEFGPLLIMKSRERYKEGRYPENMEKLVINNTSPLEADISFCFQHDSKGETFLLDPPNMTLKPGDTQTLTIWAYPRSPEVYEDAIVCCIRENPEPVVFKVTCVGVKAELELDKKALHFEKVLLHRKDTKTIYLRNSTMLPVRWKLSLLENLGDDFTVAADNGIVEPRSEYPLHFYFRAMKPVQSARKMIRLEIYDVDEIFGMFSTENITVTAEAYDIALDMSFPKGADGGLDFGTIRVGEEQKQQCTLKNRGKYEIQYQFDLEDCDPDNPNASKLFTIIPQKGSLSPLDRPTQVTVLFKSMKEVHIKDQAILKCLVIEPNVAEGGEIIASIPVKVTVKAGFNKYNILPMNDINFGSMIVNSKKTRQFVIQNKGEFDMKYTIVKMIKETQQSQTRHARPPIKDNKRSKSRDGSSSGRSVARPKKADSVSEYSTTHSQIQLTSGVSRMNNVVVNRRLHNSNRQEGVTQSRLPLQMFVVSPAIGMISSNNSQVINVECIAETPGSCEEELAIDISDRDPNDNPGGIPYKLIAEACIPSINVDDIGSIFEEHRVCKNLSVWQHNNQLQMENEGGVYGEDEKKFVFNNVIVGHKATARFKIANVNKVPCDVVMSLKPILVKGMTKHLDVFEIEPAKALIPNHSHVYATVTFTPPSMQTFSATFEASIEGVPSNQAKGRTLTFDISGEGNLPRISIQKPTVRNKRGQPLVLFKRILLGRSDTMPLVLVNDGTLPSKVDIDLIDPDKAFQLKPKGSTQAVMEDDFGEVTKRPHTASVIVNVGEAAAFDVIFKPGTVQRSQAHIRLTVIDNQYEDSVIQLVGEGYEEEITLDNITSVEVPVDPENEEGNMAEDDVGAAKPNLMKFGDCAIGEPRTLTFAMTNHSKTDIYRFQWPENAQLKFSPNVGHLHPKATKDMTVTFKSDQPKTLTEEKVNCKVNKITFDKPEKVSDWDDRIRTVKWVDVPTSPQPSSVNDGGNKAPLSSRPAKKKVIETETEPAFTEVSDTTRQVDLLVTALCDYSKYKCKIEAVNYRDTLMFQTRVYDFTLSNKGTVQMDYSWQVVMENMPTFQRAVTFMSEAERPESRMDLADSSYVPFTIEPEYGTIQAGKKASFKVRFSPLDMNDYEARLICSVPNLEKSQQGPVVALRGKSLMPYCHFELEDSDYISSSRRNPEMRGPRGAPAGSTLDPNTRVIEFNCIGVGVKNLKTFGIVNPTNQPYTFEWSCEDELDPKKPPSFNCVVPKGLIKSGKKFQVSFEYISNQVDIVESFWKFHIPEQDITVPFLLVGKAREPDISMDRSHMNFKALLIGHQAVERVYLINQEDQPFSFSFEEDSCHSAGYSDHLRVEPMSGNIPAKSRLAVDLYFTPTTDKEVNFNIVCRIKKKVLPVTLNVKAEGYSMNCTLTCEDSQGNKQEFFQDTRNIIKFGEVEVNEQQIRNIFVMNSGKFNFDFQWELNTGNKKKDMVSISPMSGGVAHGEEQKCSLLFCPPCKATLKDCSLTLRISNGPSYHVALEGLGVTPGLHFSFQTCNFGSCFIYRAGMPAHYKVLKLTNKDKKEISVDCLYTQTNHLHHNFEACVIQPGQSVDVTITFYPRQAIKYNETLTFEINGLSKHSIQVLGCGTEMKIEVADPRHKILNLGPRVVNDVVKKYIPIVNNSPAPITFNLALTPVSAALQKPGVISISPTNTITLEPKGGTIKVEVIFAPKCRIPQFTEEVMLECAGLYQPLFVLQGSCLGMEIILDTHAIPFGAVVKDSQSTRKLVMSNTGDMNTKFKWDNRKFAPDFSITPAEGYITSGMDVTFEVTFHPKQLNQDIRYDSLRCMFPESSPHKPVTLTLTGMCVSLPPPKETQHLTTHVRQAETKFLSIPNKTNMTWNLKPIIDGEYWSGPVTFTVEAGQTKQFPLTYRPLTMTPEGKKHQGTIFFPMPDGQGLLFNMMGVSEPPKPNGKPHFDVPCKVAHTELLSVDNWLKRPQRFAVLRETIKAEKLDTGTSVKGMEYIDVPASGKKDYKLTFYAHKEGTTMLKVTFINEKTQEYQFYEVTFKATKQGTVGSIDLSTPVRQSVLHTISIENPLAYAVSFNGTCTIPEVLMPPQFNVPANSTGEVSIEYQPLKVGDFQGKIEYICTDLGSYTYDLNLKATAAGPEKALYFRTCLGQAQSHIAKFLNFAKQAKADYTCKTDNSDFHVEKSVAAAPGSTGGTEVNLEVTFEPSRLGEQRAMLTVSSLQGGEYIFPLFGTCIVPKPQGPYIIKAGGTTHISFRNVFSSTTPFMFQVDNPLFHLTKQSESVRSRKEHRIVVGFDGNDSGSKAVVMGKLVVSCARSAGGNSNAQWVYYLRGVTS